MRLWKALRGLLLIVGGVALFVLTMRHVLLGFTDWGSAHSALWWAAVIPLRVILAGLAALIVTGGAVGCVFGVLAEKR